MSPHPPGVGWDLIAALLLAEQVADLGEQLDVGGFGRAGLLAAQYGKTGRD